MSAQSLKKSKAWSVRITLPKGVEQAWAVNRALTVIADTLAEAIAATLEVYPKAVVHGVQHRGEGEVILAGPTS